MTWEQWGTFWETSDTTKALEAMDKAHDGIMAAKDTHARRGWFDLMLKLYERFPAIQETWEYVENAQRLVK